MKISSERAVLILATLLAGCSRHDARSADYFAAHLDEARTIVAACRNGSVRGDECANAGSAIEQADAAARFKRFRDD